MTEQDVWSLGEVERVTVDGHIGAEDGVLAGVLVALRIHEVAHLEAEHRAVRQGLIEVCVRKPVGFSALYFASATALRCPPRSTRSRAASQLG